MKLFPLKFWLLTLTTVFFYNIIFPFLANARCMWLQYKHNINNNININNKVFIESFFFLFSEFFHDKYSGYSRNEGAYIAGTVFDLSLVLPAVFGVLFVSLFFISSDAM